MTQTIQIVKTDIDGKFGKQVLLATGKYASFSPKYNGDKAPALGSYQAEVYVTEKGNLYLNSLSAAAVTAAVVAEAPKVTAIEAKMKKGIRVVSVKDAPNDDAKWDAINRGKVKSLFVQALLSNPNVMQSLDGVDVQAVAKIVDVLTEYVFGTAKLDSK